MPRYHRLRPEAQPLRAQGLSYREIADRLGVSYETAYRAINKGKMVTPDRRRKLIPCPDCGSPMTLDRRRHATCSVCGITLNTYQRLSPEQRRQAISSATKYREGRRSELQRLIAEAKDRPCVDCNQSYPPFVMHFHHVRGTKRFRIAAALARCPAPATLRKEIAKCDLLCANCHALRHQGVYAPAP